LTGRVVGLHVAPAAGTPPETRDRVRVVAGGVRGDRYCRGAGQFSRVGDGHPVTLVPARAVAAAERAVGARLDPGWHRRNVAVAGVDLDAARGATLGVGDARLRVTRDRPPCAHLEAVVGVDGVAAALRGRAGVCAEVAAPGDVAVGDPVRVVEASPREAGRRIAARLRDE
jgi:MOSC domain-containing protein YiiM